jgi:peptide/nickel transport system permease protein
VTTFIIRRLLLAIPTLLVISILAFVIIQLPDGDYLHQKIAELEQQFGDSSSVAQADALRKRYGLDRPMWEQYYRWVSGFVRGDFGQSFRYDREVNELIWERLGYTLVISIAALLFTYALAIPLGIYSATRKYGVTDNALTFMSFFGMSVPGFLLALALMVVAFQYFDTPLFGLFSQRYEDAPWSIAKLGDLLNHLWIPVIVVAINGTAGLMRIMRGNLLDVLGQPFIQTARAKGLKERIVVTRHAARIAINPLITILGMSLPDILSGATIVSIVLGLPTVGPLLFRALLDQDMFLAGTITMMFSILLIIGNLLADIALAWADPRIRYD